MASSKIHGIPDSLAPTRVRIAVVILSLNRSSDTIQCVESVLKSTLSPAQVVVLDNGSRDEEYQSLKEGLQGRADLIRAETNLGVARGWNAAIKHVRGQYDPEFIFLLNNDAVVDRTVLEELVRFAQREPKSGALGPPIVDFEPPRHHQHGILAKVEKPTEDFLLSGCAILIRSAVFDKIGFFDEDYIVYGEETDFLARMRGSGWTPYYVPVEGKVFHKGAATSQAMSGFEAYHRARSQLVFIAKNRRGMRLLSSLGSYFIHWQLLGYASDLRSADRWNRLVSRTRGIVDGALVFPEMRRKSRA